MCSHKHYSCGTHTPLPENLKTLNPQSLDRPTALDTPAQAWALRGTGTPAMQASRHSISSLQAPLKYITQVTNIKDNPTTQTMQT